MRELFRNSAALSTRSEWKIMNEKSIWETVAIFPVIRTFLQRALNRDPVSNSFRRRLSSCDRSKDLSEGIGASCRLISSPTPESRDPSCSEGTPSPPYPPTSGRTRSRRECTKLQRHSYLPEPGGREVRMRTRVLGEFGVVCCVLEVR